MFLKQEKPEMRPLRMHVLFDVLPEWESKIKGYCMKKMFFIVKIQS